MLSFLREQEPGNSPVQKPQETADSSGSGRTGEEKLSAGSPSGVPRTATGEHSALNTDGQQEYLTVAAQDKNVRRTTCLFAVLFGIGLLCLWFMIKKSTPQAASASLVSAEETQIEMAITRLTGVRSEIFNRMERVVEKFYEFSDVQQVGVNELVKNPFKRQMFLGDLNEISDTEGRQLDETEMVRRQARDFELLSIMQSDQRDGGWSCMINDKILYEGDSIGGFKVRQISDSFVKLEWDTKRSEERLETELEGMEIILKLLE